ncbi:MAG TPA: Crp/Fnr family transcriptional regulator [Thermoanaerobaculia bacterium]|nr:Crp/Fnr family transcriptional regulator [Thermoanaerobaculia bacterium]
MNRLLAALPAEDLQALRPQMEEITLELHTPLIVPNEPIEYVIFPITALASLVTVLEDGSTVEAGSVGHEGMVGIPILLNATSTPMETVTQVGGTAIRIPSEAVKRQFDGSPAMHALLHKYIHALFIIASQSTACNRRHQVDERLARWLLMSADGIRNEEVAITHEYLATMLGVRRPGVTEAALKLQEDGLIQYRRGGTTIIDRRGLEARACECYHVVKNTIEGVFN